jgi:hypothetical protein
VENAFLHLKQWRDIATTYTKNTASFVPIVQIRCAILWAVICLYESSGLYRFSYHLTPASNRCLVYATLVRTSFGINFRPF